MAKFELIPIAERLNDPAWAFSTERRPCYVSAESELEARELAALEFVVPVSGNRPMPKGLPWLNPSLTECRPIAEFGPDRMPHGSIYVAEWGRGPQRY